MKKQSAFSTQHSALSIQHSAFSTQHSAFSTQHSAFSTQHSALSTQHSALSIQHSRWLNTECQVPSASSVDLHRFGDHTFIFSPGHDPLQPDLHLGVSRSEEH